MTGNEISGDDECRLKTDPVLVRSDSFWLEWKWLHLETERSDGKLAAGSYESYQHFRELEPVRCLRRKKKAGVELIY